MGGGRTYRYTLAEFSRFCSGLVLDSGKSMALEPFQRTIVRPYFDGRRETVAVLPTGNAKSTLLAALALFHHQRTPNAEVIVAASAADQAEYVFLQAAGLIERSDLDKLFDVKRGIRAIYHRGSPSSRPSGRIRVISADAGRNDGAIPTLALVDELHRHRDKGELYGMLRDKLTKRGGQMVTISTAGFDPGSPLALLRDKAHEHKSFTRRGMLNRAEIGPLVFLEWCLGENDDPDDLKLVKRANPLRHITISELADRRASPMLVWPQWLRYTCGLWTATEDPWIDAATWDGMRVDIGGIEQGEEVVMHFTRGEGGAAIALAASREDDALACKVFTLTGNIPFAHLENEIIELTKRYVVRECSYGEAQLDSNAERLAARGINIVNVPHSTERLSSATGTLHRLVQAKLLRHDGDPALRTAALAGTTTETQRGWHLVKETRTRPLIALAFAAHQATQVPPELPEFVAL